MITIFGPAGSGKSLQGQILANRYDLIWLSVGGLLRERAKDDAQLKEVLDTGALVDDEYVVAMMHEAYAKAKAEGKEVLLDGYPRDERQAQFLVESGDIKDIQGALILTVDKEELWKRIQERGREDDALRETVEKRWAIYEENIAKIVPILEANGVEVGELNGMGEPEEVTARIEDALEDWEVIPRVEYDDTENEHEQSYGE